MYSCDRTDQLWDFVNAVMRRAYRVCEPPCCGQILRCHRGRGIPRNIFDVSCVCSDFPSNSQKLVFNQEELSEIQIYVCLYVKHHVFDISNHSLIWL